METTVQKDLDILNGYLDPIKDLKSVKEQQDEYKWLYQQCRNTINPMLFSQINDGDSKIEEMESVEQMKKFVEDAFKLLRSAGYSKKGVNR